MDVDSLGKLLVEEIEKYKKAMGIAVKEEKDEGAVKDKTDKEITEMKKEPMEKRKLPMPTWQSKKPKNDDPKDSLAPPPPPPTTTRRTDVGHRSGNFNKLALLLAHLELGNWTEVWRLHRVYLNCI